MAAVIAELMYRDGQREKISVTVENNLCSLISGVHELNTNVSQLLSKLVERDNTCGDCTEGEEAEEDSDEENEPPSACLQPPVKKSKS
ncbi:pld2 [Pungitius sinensis]